MNRPTSEQAIKELVRNEYGQAALQVKSGGSSCCGDKTAGKFDPITSNLYRSSETGSLPLEALLASLGCGNPTPWPN